MRLQAGGISFVLRKLAPPEVLLECVASGARKCTDETHLLRSILSGEVVQEGLGERARILMNGANVLRETEAALASHVAIEVACDKLEWLKMLHNRGVDTISDKPWIRSELDKIAKSAEMKGRRKYSISTLEEAQRLLRKADGDPLALVPNYKDRGGRGVLRIDARAVAIAREVCRTHVDRGGRICKRDLIAEIGTRIDAHNSSEPRAPVKTPGETTLRRLIKAEIPAIHISKANRGPRSAARAYRENEYPRDRAVRPLEVSEYDDVDSGVFLVDEEARLPYGRAWITNGIDRGTLVPLGFDLSDRERAYESAIGAICHSLLPKAVEDGDLHWDGYGCQGTILMDRAPYNFSRAAKEQSRSLSLLLAAARPYGPTEKSCIEHFNHVIKEDFSAGLPGWRGTKGDREAINEGICGSAMTVREFRSAYYRWVCKGYMNTPGEDGRTPRQRWQRFYSGFGPAVRYSNEQLSLFRLVPESLTFRDSGGLLRLHLRYTSKELRELRKRLGANESVVCFVDRFDLSYLVVKDPFTGTLLRVDCVEDQRLVKGLTEYQQGLILAACYRKRIKNPAIAQQIEAREEIWAATQKARRSTKLRRRKQAQRMSSMPMSDKTDPPAASAEPQREVVLTELESQMSDLQEIADQVLKEMDDELR